MTDELVEIRATLAGMRLCCASWEPDVCVLGNVRAGDAIAAVDGVLCLLAEADAREKRLRDAGAECADDLEAHIEADYPQKNRDNHPHLNREYERAIAPVNRFRDACRSEKSGQSSDAALAPEVKP